MGPLGFNQSLIDCCHRKVYIGLLNEELYNLFIFTGLFRFTIIVNYSQMYCKI